MDRGVALVLRRSSRLEFSAPEGDSCEPRFTNLHPLDDLASTLQLDTSISTDTPLLGEVIDVTIDARALVDVEARIVARLECVADGETTDIWEIEKLRLFEGQLAAGTRTFEAVFELPRLAPLPVRANLFHIEWRVVVEADAWSSKIEKVVQEVEFRPQAPTSLVAMNEPHPGELVARDDLAGQRQLFVVICVLLPIPAVMIGGLVHPLAGLAFIIIMGLIFGPTAAPVIRRELGKRRLGEVRLEVDPSVPRIGEIFVVALDFEPTSQADITAVWLTVRGRERTTRISSGGQVAAEREFFQESKELDIGGLDVGVGPVALSANFLIPEQLIPTIAFEHNQVEWRIDVKIELEGWADFEEEHVVRVLGAWRLEADVGSPVARKEG